MFANFMSDQGYCTYYLTVDLTNRSYKTMTVYEEDPIHGADYPNWDNSNTCFTVKELNTLFIAGLYEKHKYDLVSITED